MAVDAAGLHDPRNLVRPGDVSLRHGLLDAADAAADRFAHGHAYSFAGQQLVKGCPQVFASHLVAGVPDAVLIVKVFLASPTDWLLSEPLALALAEFRASVHTRYWVLRSVLKV